MLFREAYSFLQPASVGTLYKPFVSQRTSLPNLTLSVFLSLTDLAAVLAVKVANPFADGGFD